MTDPSHLFVQTRFRGLASPCSDFRRDVRGELFCGCSWTYKHQANLAHLQARRISAAPNSSILFTMRTRIITTAGIALCSLFPAIATLGDTVIVPAPRATVITEVPAPPTVNTVVRALDSSRYQLIEKKDNKEVYRDTQTGEKWILEIEHRNR